MQGAPTTLENRGNPRNRLPTLARMNYAMSAAHAFLPSCFLYRGENPTDVGTGVERVVEFARNGPRRSSDTRKQDSFSGSGIRN